MSKIQILAKGQKEWSTIHGVTEPPLKARDSKVLVFKVQGGRGAIALKNVVAWVFLP